MPRIITAPDFDHSVRKILITNCPWTHEQLQEFVPQLSDKEYDIYVHNNDGRNIEWAEGIRTSAVKVLDYRYFNNIDPIEWLRTLDDFIK
jgi:hypothetical protein